MILSFENWNIHNDQIAARKRIAEAILPLMDKIDRLQIFQSTVWCGNTCAMCSQGASTGITRIEQINILDILAALKGNVEWILGTTKLWFNRIHKPGIIFPYLDNDCWSDPNLLTIIRVLWEDFWSKVRISTVGYSRHNKQLQEMHRKIAEEMYIYIDGFRLSITPYTAHFFSEDYIADIANLLYTYRNLIIRQWTWRDKFACELRWPPFIEIWEVEAGLWKWRFYIRSWNYCFLAKDANQIKKTKIKAVIDRQVQFDDGPLEWYLFKKDWLEEMSMVDIDLLSCKEDASLYYLENIDGDLYAINPLFKKDGSFSAIHFLPKTDSRTSWWVLDSTRPFLNAMLQYKRESFWIDSKDKLKNGDIDHFINFLQTYIRQAWYTSSYRQFLEEKIFPIIFVISQAIKLSGLGDDYFFDPGFLVDTGHIVNQGRARSLFEWLVSQDDEPITVNEMKWYGDKNSTWSERGTVYRIAPTPINWYTGMRNTITSEQGLIIGWLHHKWLQSIPEETYVFDVPIKKLYIPRTEIIKSFGIPGLPFINQHGIKK